MLHGGALGGRQARSRSTGHFRSVGARFPRWRCPLGLGSDPAEPRRATQEHHGQGPPESFERVSLRPLPKICAILSLSLSLSTLAVPLYHIKSRLRFSTPMPTESDSRETQATRSPL